MAELDTMPLPIPAADDVPSFEEVRDRLRAVYSQAISDIADRCAEELLLPDHRATMFLDLAQFTTFLMCVKIVEARGEQPTRENLLKAFWPAQKALKDDVLPMLRTFAEQVG